MTIAATVCRLPQSLLTLADRARRFVCCKRRAVVAIHVVMLTAVALAGVLSPRGEEANAAEADAASFSELRAMTEVAEAFDLNWTSDPPNHPPIQTIYVSYRKLDREDLCELFMHDPNFDHWQGIVRIGRNPRNLLDHNYDPAHPERFVQHGQLYFYGDPELIKKLVAK